MNRSQLIRRIFIGVLAGALAGIVIGDYIAEISIDLNYPKQNYQDSFYSQLYWMVAFPYIIVFAVMGPYIAVAFTGLQIRNAVYGFFCTISIIVLGTIIVAVINGIYIRTFVEYPSGYKIGVITEELIFGLHDSWEIGFPFALIFGPPIGIFAGKRRKPSKEASQKVAATK